LDGEFLVFLEGDDGDLAGVRVGECRLSGIHDLGTLKFYVSEALEGHIAENEGFVEYSGNSKTPFFVRDSAPKSLLKRDAKMSNNGMRAVLPRHTGETLHAMLMQAAFQNIADDSMTLDLWVMIGMDTAPKSAPKSSKKTKIASTDDSSSSDSVNARTRGTSRTTSRSATSQVQLQTFSFKVYIYPLVYCL
jgi:hypothetical protein